MYSPEILVYEDEDFGSRIARHLHEDLGVSTAVCWDPNAIPWEQRLIRVCLFVVDINLYGSNRGLEIIDRLVAQRQGRRPFQIVVLSAFKDQRDPSLSRGADVFLEKDDYESSLANIKAAFSGLCSSYKPYTPRTQLYPALVLSVDEQAVLVALQTPSGEIQRAVPRDELGSIGADVAGTLVTYVAVSEGNETKGAWELPGKTGKVDDSWKGRYLDIVKRWFD